MSPLRFPLYLLLLGLLAIPASAQVTVGKWNEIIGKKIVNNQGVTLGRVKDTVVDIENGRYVGILVSYGGFLGIGQSTKIVPPGATSYRGTPDTLYVDMDKSRFRQAPTFAMSKVVGPPYASQVAEVYRYFGQTPFFTTQPATTPNAPNRSARLGYTQRTANILRMPVENLQGLTLGTVAGFRDLNPTTGRIAGVIINPTSEFLAVGRKIVEPEDLRYNPTHTALRINNREQSFVHSPSFEFTGSGFYAHQDPERPGELPAPLVQGTSASDKAITLRIQDAILGDSSLSNFGENMEVATVKGKTIVRGRVVSNRNRNRILSHAYSATGRANVTDMIVVRPLSAREQAIAARSIAP